MADDRLSHQQSHPHGSPRPIAIVVGLAGSLIGIGVLVLLLIQSIEITVDPGSDDLPSQAPLEQDETVSPPVSEGSPSAAPVETPSDGLVEVAPPSAAPQTEATANASSDTRQTGGLRVSNQTMVPIRLTLLSQGGAMNEAEPSIYQEPVHWDFAPGEGAAKGLLLAIPDDSLRLRSGDVLAAFAQDGSQRYWGPYVVGATSSPQWNEELQEWELVFRVE